MVKVYRKGSMCCLIIGRMQHKLQLTSGVELVHCILMHMHAKYSVMQLELHPFSARACPQWSVKDSEVDRFCTFHTSMIQRVHQPNTHLVNTQ